MIAVAKMVRTCVLCVCAVGALGSCSIHTVYNKRRSVKGCGQHFLGHGLKFFAHGASPLHKLDPSLILVPMEILVIMVPEVVEESAVVLVARVHSTGKCGSTGNNGTRRSG